MQNVIYVLSASIIGRFSLLLINFLSAQLLLVDMYGLMAYILTLVGVVSSFVLASSGTSVNVTATKYLTTNQHAVSSFINFSILISLLISPITYSIIIFLNQDVQSKFIYIYPYILLLTFLYSYNSINDKVFIGSKNYKYLFRSNLITFCICLPIIIFLIYYGQIYWALLSILIYRFIYSLAHQLFLGKTTKHKFVLSIYTTQLTLKI